MSESERKKHTIEIDISKLGFSLSAYIFISISLRELKQKGITTRDLINITKRNPNIESVENVTGDVDIVIKIHSKNINELNDYVVNTLGDYTGVENTTTALILE